MGDQGVKHGTGGEAKYYSWKRFLFPLSLGVAMPLVMALKQGQALVFPWFLWQLGVYELLALLFGVYLIPMGIISDSFVHHLHAQEPRWLYLIVSQIPGAIIFSLIMGVAAVVMNAGVTAANMYVFLTELPVNALLALAVQIVVDLLLERIIKPLFDGQ